MRSCQNFECAVRLVCAIEMQPNREHFFETLRRGLHVSDPVFRGPGTETWHLKPRTHRQRKILMPRPSQFASDDLSK
jgi:hypothetical protein